jgi:hypothetical protein
MSVCNYFGLSDWFDVSFSDSEKDILIFCPLFSEPLGDGVPCASYFLAQTLAWYDKKDNSDIVLKMCDKIIELFNDDNKKMSFYNLHFFYTMMITSVYKFRDTWAGELVVELCNKSIEIAPRVVGEFKYPAEHVGFNSLIAIEKKAHNWPRVLELSRLALSQGWAGKFADWAAEAEKKLNALKCS